MMRIPINSVEGSNIPASLGKDVLDNGLGMMGLSKHFVIL